MHIILTSQAKEDISALALIDQRAYQKLHQWLGDPEHQLSEPGLSVRLCIDDGLTLFSRPLSEVHRLVYTYQNDKVVILQCRFHF